MTVLILGGSAEGRELAARLHERGVAVVSSLAGRVPDPVLPPGEVRVGGFGGTDGLAGYLRSRRIQTVVDATHPFAARITANAVEACTKTGTELVVLHRPPWTPHGGDNWRAVPDLDAAATALQQCGDDARVLLSTGRQGVRAFRGNPQRFWLRAVHPPDDADLPPRCELILDRGPFTVEAERELFRQKQFDVLVSKNSGGGMTAAKLAVARERHLPVVMVQRPPLPPGVPAVDSVAAALVRLDATVGAHPSSPG